MNNEEMSGRARAKVIALWVLLVGGGVLVAYLGALAYFRSLARTMAEIAEGQVRTELGVGAHQVALPHMEPIGLMRAEAVRLETAQMVPGWEAVGEFLAANEAMGRVGAALADGAMGWPGDLRADLGLALQDAAARLARLARAVGVDLREI